MQNMRNEIKNRIQNFKKKSEVYNLCSHLSKTIKEIQFLSRQKNPSPNSPFLFCSFPDHSKAPTSQMPQSLLQTFISCIVFHIFPPPLPCRVIMWKSDHLSHYLNSLPQRISWELIQQAKLLTILPLICRSHLLPILLLVLYIRSLGSRPQSFHT